jgi:hypothetical protein
MMHWEHLWADALLYPKEVDLRSPSCLGAYFLIDDPFQRQTFICLWDGFSNYGN